MKNNSEKPVHFNIILAFCLITVGLLVNQWLLGYIFNSTVGDSIDSENRIFIWAFQAFCIISGSLVYFRRQKLRVKSWLVYCMYFTVVFATVFFLLECMTRVLKLAPPLSGRDYSHYITDPYLPYRVQPFMERSGRSLTDEFYREVKCNSAGFWDVEHSLEKPEGVFRILGIGDSFTWGAGSSFLHETYLYRLEEMLNSRGGKHPTVEIIKAGIPRYFPEPERLLLEHYGVDYSPDIVLVGFVPGDVIDTYMGINAVTVSKDKSGYLVTKEADRLGKIGGYLFVHSHVCRIVLKKYISYQISKTHTPKMRQVYEPDGFHEKDWKAVESEYEKMIDIAHSVGTEIVFFQIPHKGPWQARHSYPAMRLSQWSKGRGVHFIDTLPAMKEASQGENLYYVKDFHCRPAGYKVIAEVLFEELLKSGIVP